MKKYLFLFINGLKNRKALILLILITTVIGVGYSKGFESFHWKFIILIFFISLPPIIFLNKKIEWVCFTIILSFGTYFVIFSPVFDVLDEPAHYARAEHVSEGNLFLKNEEDTLAFSKDYGYLTELTGYNGMNRLDPQVNFFQSNLFKKKHNTEKEIETKIKATRTYGSLMYFPSAAGLYIGKIISGGNLGVMFYLGRFFNLIMYAIMAFFAIKLAGSWKLIVGFFSIQHLPIYISASFSQDAFFYGLSLLIFSKLINFFDTEEKITTKDILIMTAYCSLMAFTKLPYVALIGLLLFIPLERYSNKKVYLLNFLAIFTVLLISLFWLRYYSNMQATDLPASVDQSAQIQYIINHPRNFINSLARAVFDVFLKYKQFFTFGWSFYYSENIHIFSLTTLGIALYFYPMKLNHNVNSWFKFALIGVSLAIVVVTNIILYLTFTGVGEADIQGVQGRYFFGILVLLPLLLNTTPSIVKPNVIELNNAIDTTRLSTILVVTSVLLLIWMATMRVGAYY